MIPYFRTVGDTAECEPREKPEPSEPEPPKPITKEQSDIVTETAETEPHKLGGDILEDCIPSVGHSCRVKHPPLWYDDVLC